MGFLVDNKIKAVAFDIDGTFYPLWKTKLRVALASLCNLPFAIRYNRARRVIRREDSFTPLPPLTKEEYGRRMSSLIYRRCDERTVLRFLKKENTVFTKRYERLFKNIKAYKSVDKVLSLLSDNGYPMGVLSDFPIGTKLRAMGIERFFAVQISSEEIGRLKPSATPFDILAEKLGVEKAAILYVGDSIYKDVEGAHKAGMKSALISAKFSSSADLSVRTWRELEEKLF